MTKLIDKTCLCGKTFQGSTRQRYCPNCIINRNRETVIRTQQRKRLNLPNVCNICGAEIPRYKQKCKQCLGYKKICFSCNKEFLTGRKHQKYCSPKCYNEFRSADKLLDNRSMNQKYQQLLKKYEALQKSFQWLEAVDKSNTLLLAKYRDENKQLKQELDYINSVN